MKIRLRYALLWLSASLLTAGGEEPRMPNVIVILADDLGYADLGRQGSKDVITPHIDSIAQNGVRYTDGYVTSPQCGPSRAGLLTGRYQNRFGFESNEFARRSIPTSEKLIYERMKEEDLARFSHIEDSLRRTLLAMMSCMDDNIGRLLHALDEEKLVEETLIIFLSENGAPAKSNASLNTPFRGGKSDIFEGGIRIPFLMQWKGNIPAGMVYEKPVISLDILPTSLAASRAACLKKGRLFIVTRKGEGKMKVAHSLPGDTIRRYPEQLPAPSTLRVHNHLLSL